MISTKPLSVLAPLGVAILLIGACGGAGSTSRAAAGVSDGATTAPRPRRASGLDAESRDALKREYRALALKNDCSRGLKDLDGTWRFIGDTKTPNYSETLTFDGTRWTSVQVGDPDSHHLEARLEGEVRCLFNNRVLIRVDKVDPPGAFGNVAGEDYPCDLLGDMAMSGDRMLLICYFDWDVRTAAGLEFEYERVKPQR